MFYVSIIWVSYEQLSAGEWSRVLWTSS